MQLGHDAEAVDALSEAMDSNPGYLRGKAWVAAAEALSGDVESARFHLAEYMALEPEMTVPRFAEERSSVPIDRVSPVYRRESQRIMEGLRLARMPDGIDVHPLHDRHATRPEATIGCNGGLPVPVTELIGRDAELSEAADMVKRHRLVTLVGEGGIGKTRLGIEVARRLLPEFTHGIRVAELAPLSDPGLVPVAVAMALGLRFAGCAISAERIADALSGKQLLLVLDNCEHVIDAQRAWPRCCCTPIRKYACWRRAENRCEQKENFFIGCRRSQYLRKIPTIWQNCCDMVRSSSS